MKMKLRTKKKKKHGNCNRWNTPGSGHLQKQGVSGETSPGRVSLACRCESSLAAAGVSASFRHCRQQNQPSHYSHRRERQEGRTVSSAYHEESCGRIAQRSRYPLHGAKHTARCIVPAGSQHYVSEHEWNKRIQGASGHPIQDLHAHQPNFVIGDRIQHTSDRQRPQIQSAKGSCDPKYWPSIQPTRLWEW